MKGRQNATEPLLNRGQEGLLACHGCYRVKSPVAPDRYHDPTSPNAGAQRWHGLAIRTLSKGCQPVPCAGALGDRVAQSGRYQRTYVDANRRSPQWGNWGLRFLSSVSAKADRDHRTTEDGRKLPDLRDRGKPVNFGLCDHATA
jgi:hypothetical protein